MFAPHLARAWALTALIVLPSYAQSPSDVEEIAFFEKHVRPLLLEHCFECHGEKKQEGGLRIDRPSSILLGGDSGNTVVPRKPEESLLWVAVAGKHPDLRMPPAPAKELTPKQIGILGQWIRHGAKIPTNEASTPGIASPAESIGKKEIDRSHWSFHSPTLPSLPRVKDQGWPRTSIDSFILAKLESSGLTPSPDTDRSTWLRRVTFDLIGLPPSVQEQIDFEQDDSLEAFDRVVDRLLASPEYGRRWGRHWLDVARYADSNGLDENIAHGNAWRYRNYAIDALNRDMPYDRFLTEQLAGDLLPYDRIEQRHEQLIATGFLSLGPKVLAEVDEKKMEMDIVDEQIDTIGKAILGLTLGCARCHDHKFDPVTMEDYYGLAGVFKSTKTMDSFTKIAKWHENTIAYPADEQRFESHQQQVTEAKKEIERRKNEAIEKAKSGLAEGESLPKDPETKFDEETKSQLKSMREALSKLEKSAPELPSAMGVQEQKGSDVPIHVRGSHLALGKMVSRRFPTVLDPQPTTIEPEKSGRLELAQWLTRADHPLTTRVLVNRVWRWHFGRGLVASTDNFGLLGEKPSHPELLDWLALQFQQRGWSIKALHREIVLSSTYRQSSHVPAGGVPSASHRLAEGLVAPAMPKVDSDNEWLSRFPIRRLEAEVIRDAILEVSGRLDRSTGRSLLHVKNREFLFDHTSIDKTKYESPLRSVFLPVIRNNLYDLFQLFDYSDAAMVTGNRNSTIVASQALFALNSAMMHESASQLAQQAWRDRRHRSADQASGTSGASLFSDLCRRLLGRVPSPSEVASAIALVDSLERSGDSPESAWGIVCHGLMASNEFIYVR